MHKKDHTHQPEPSLSHRSACPGFYRMPIAADGHLCRIKLEQGRIGATQWRVLAKAAQDYGNGIIDITTRANLQLRGVKSNHIESVTRLLEEGGFAPKSKRGDDVRNVMVNPTAGFDIAGDKRILDLAQDISHHLQITKHYQTLSPKFSLLLDGGERCAMVHHRHDIWLCVCDAGKNFAFGLASRPPLVGEKGEKSLVGEKGEESWVIGKVPFEQGRQLIFALIDYLLLIRRVRPQIQRMKQLIHVVGYQAIIDFLQQKLRLLQPADDFRREKGEAFAHLGIQQAAKLDRFYLGVKPPFGRLQPDLCHLLADCAEGLRSKQTMRLTPWQSIIFPNCTYDEAHKLAETLTEAGFIHDKKQPLARMMCCSGLFACQSAKADVRRDGAYLAHRLGGDDFPLIHMTACDKSCAANEASPITIVAVDANHYDLFIAKKNASSRFGHRQASHATIEEVAKFLLPGTSQFP